jgi:hypothetical protein
MLEGQEQGDKTCLFCKGHSQPNPSSPIDNIRSRYQHDAGRTFNRIQGARSKAPPNFYLSEYSGAFGSQPSMEPYWGGWGSLKLAGPYLKEASPAYNPYATQSLGPARWKAPSSVRAH